MTGCGSPVRQARIIDRNSMDANFRMYFPPSQSLGQALYPCKNAADIAGYFTMRWQHGSGHIIVPYRLESRALRCRMVDFWLPEGIASASFGGEPLLASR
ncbi:hypothetical protein TcG_06740 [Trypanosoma cruzi]|nr:hypothetical protein TcG_06740 [Trypanosoma cruzi]